MKERTYEIDLDGKKFIEVVSSPEKIDCFIHTLRSVFRSRVVTYGEVCSDPEDDFDPLAAAYDPTLLET